MLTITIPEQEMFNEETSEFITYPETVICLEHSLVSLSKWESKWNKPFLNQEAKTNEETLDYIKCMTISQNIKDDVYNRLTNENIQAIKDYIEAPMTATTFNEYNKKISREIITSELIYYWMIACNIPMECQKWHLNRLLTLIRVCSIKNEPPKKMSTNEIMSRNAALNAARRKQLHTKG